MTIDTAEYPEYLLAQGDAARLPLPDKSVDLVIGSPPYCDARTYGIGAQRDAREWVNWMLGVTAEAVRVSRGLVLWVCAGVTRDHCYWPACEGLLWEWWKAGGKCWRPVYWHRIGIPGSGGRKWLRADIEYVLAFKGEENDFWMDNLAMGHPPRCNPGGRMSNRMKDGDRQGTRRSPWGGSVVASGRKADGSAMSRKLAFSISAVNPDSIANPGNLISTGVSGGGNIGSSLAHENEAPFPEDLAEFFVRSACPPGGLVLDPFSGSGTSAAVALKNGRQAIGFDLRRSQADLGTRRIAESLRPVSRLDGAVKPVKPLAGQLDLF